MCFYSRKFVKGYVAIVTHLNNTLKKSETTLEWEDDCENSFICLKQALTSSLVLIFPQMARQFIITTDGSYSAIGYSLSQIGPDRVGMVLIRSHAICDMKGAHLVDHSLNSELF